MVGSLDLSGNRTEKHRAWMRLLHIKSGNLSANFVDGWAEPDFVGTNEKYV